MDQELEEIKLKEATLLHDFQVRQWLKWRDERGFPKLKEHISANCYKMRSLNANFVVKTSRSMTSFAFHWDKRK